VTFFYDFLSLKNDVNVPVFRIRIRIRIHRIRMFRASRQTSQIRNANRHRTNKIGITCKSLPGTDGVKMKKKQVAPATVTFSDERLKPKLQYKANMPYSNWKRTGKDPELALGPVSATVASGGLGMLFLGGKTTGTNLRASHTDRQRKILAFSSSSYWWEIDLIYKKTQKSDYTSLNKSRLNYFLAMLRILIRDPHFSESVETVFRAKNT
jgi:hypothetical protein